MSWGAGRIGEAYRKEESRCSINLLGWRLRLRRGHERKSTTELEMRMGHWSWRNGGGSEDLQLSYLLPWSERIGGS